MKRHRPKLQDRQRIATFFQSAARHANSIGGVQRAPNFFRSNLLGEQIAIQLKNSANLGWNLVQKFDSEVADTLVDQRRHDFGGALRNGIKQSVPAPDIGMQWMFAAHSVAELHQVRIAGTPAVGFIRAG